MKEWKIPVRYEIHGVITVKANTLDDALYKAENCGLSDIAGDEFERGTFQIDVEDPEYIRELYNNGQKDEESEETVART